MRTWRVGCDQDSALPVIHNPRPRALAEEGIAAGGVRDLRTALQEALKIALIHNSRELGIHEGVRVLDKY